MKSLKFDIYVMTSIKNTIRRGSYLWTYFYDDDSNVIFNRLNEYISSQTIDSDIVKDNDVLYINTLVDMLEILNRNRYKYDFYNYLYKLCEEKYYDLYCQNIDFLLELKRDDYDLWLRGYKISKIKEKMIINKNDRIK